jgi:hypothetical protein
MQSCSRAVAVPVLNSGLRKLCVLKKAQRLYF